MLTRTAIYEGRVREGCEEAFFRRVRDELEPIWRRFPNAKAVRVQRTRSADEGAPAIAMILEMDFETQAALDACLASPIKSQAHAATESVMTLFDGRFYHIVAESTATQPEAG